MFLWICLTKFTITSSLQLSVTAFQEILEFDPEVYKFHIPSINTKLLNLFVLTTTPHQTVQDAKRIQHTVTVYGRIQQSQTWATWVANQVDHIEDGQVTNHQDFMNSAALKYAKIHTNEGGFHASTNTIQEDIVVMMAKAKRKHVSPGATRDPSGAIHDATCDNQSGGSAGDDVERPKRPPFLKYYKVSYKPNAKMHKVGDTRTWKNSTYYYCDCPNHRGRVRWHKHKAEDCTARKTWLVQKSSGDANPEAHVTDGPPVANDTDAETGPNGSADASALLANAYALLGANPAVKDLVADALTALEDSEE